MNLKFYILSKETKKILKEEESSVWLKNYIKDDLSIDNIGLMDEINVEKENFMIEIQKNNLGNEISRYQRLDFFDKDYIITFEIIDEK